MNAFAFLSLKGDIGGGKGASGYSVDCRLRAADCHKMAQTARRPHVRDTLAEIERMWNRLAVEAEVSEAMLTRFLGGAAFGPTRLR